MENPSVYLETSFVSYLTAKPSRNLIIAAHQNITLDWWENRRQNFELFISQVVIDEAKLGDLDAATRRLKVLENIPHLAISKEIADFSSKLIDKHLVPASELRDAIHIATSCVSGIDYLLTWNCKHIANAQKRKEIEKMCAEFGYVSPVICTPEELLGD